MPYPEKTVRRPRQDARLARTAIAEFVDSNIPRFNGWLQQVAEGIPQYDGNGEVVKASNGSTVWVVRPDPATALKITTDICEYHLPKLSRADVAVVAQVEHLHDLPIEQVPSAELRRRLLESLGMNDLISGQTIEGKLVPDAEPIARPTEST